MQRLMQALCAGKRGDQRYRIFVQQRQDGFYGRGAAVTKQGNRMVFIDEFQGIFFGQRRIALVVIADEFYGFAMDTTLTVQRVEI